MAGWISSEVISPASYDTVRYSSGLDFRCGTQSICYSFVVCYFTCVCVLHVLFHMDRNEEHFNRQVCVCVLHIKPFFYSSTSSTPSVRTDSSP